MILLVGGRSTEHDTSLHSYVNVLADVLADPRRELEIAGVYYVDLENAVHAHRVAPWPRSPSELASSPPEPLLEILSELERSAAPIFPLMHGNEGEDGAWQGLAEIIGLKGTFGPLLPSALAMSKFHMSLLATSLASLRMPGTVFLDHRSTERELGEAIETFAGHPCIVKPNAMGSSLFASRLDSLDLPALKRLRADVLPYDPGLLIQEYIRGDEYTAGCLEIGGEVVVLPIIKAMTSSGFLGHAEKHKPGLVHPETLGPDTPLATRIREVTRALSRCLGFPPMCRFDFLHAPDGALYFLEANTLPGLAKGSAYTLMLRAAGYRMTDLIRACIEAAARRPERRKVLRYDLER